MLNINDRLNQWDRDHFIHPVTAYGGHERGETPTKIFETGQGVFVFDRDGRGYLDAFAGLWCVNVGYGRSEIADAIADQAHRLAYFNAYFGNGTEAAITLSRMIAERTPEGLNHVYFGMSGSDANDTNIKYAWYYHNVRGNLGKKKIISRKSGFHGLTSLTAGVTGIPMYHEAFNMPLHQALTASSPNYYRRDAQHLSLTEEEYSDYLADELEQLIRVEGEDTIAAFIAEPLQGSGGIIPPTKGYWEKIQKVLRKYDILFILDEVVTGFGRLGTMFGADFYGIDPDLMSVAKGLTSGYAPLSASIVHDRVWRVLAEGNDRMGPMKHGWTYSAHPISVAAGVANLKLIDSLDLLTNVQTVGTYFRQALSDRLSAYPFVGDIRGEGMVAAVELVEDKETRRAFDPSIRVGGQVAAAMLQDGVIARGMNGLDIIGLAPPLCLTRAEADTIVDVIEKSLAKINTKAA